MKYYIDITLIPDAEANLGFLWGKVFQQVHLALVENKASSNNSEIALSIPEYRKEKFPLGGKLRLLAPSQQLLQKLNISEWLNRLTDYTHCTSIREVPSSVSEFAIFKRARFIGNAERLARRRAKRKNECFEQSLKHYDGFKQQETDLPFVNIRSLSGGHQFKLFIKKESVSQTKISGFDCYGLSKEATVPCF